jgi:predicted ArsR family transcriptional regulator
MPIRRVMAESDAWRSLSGSAVKVYVELRSRFNGRNNGDLSLSFDEASNLLALGKSTVARAFAELEAKGFIRKTAQGRFIGRTASTWLVTDQKHKGHHASNDWRRWRYPKTDPRYCGGTMRAVAARQRTGGEKK